VPAISLLFAQHLKSVKITLMKGTRPNDMKIYKGLSIHA
jgi:hypothetical protein